ncbi:MAG: hypothetical protein R3E47_05935 [Paracoccaceae bacterium]
MFDRGGQPWFVVKDVYRAIALPLGSQDYHMKQLAEDEMGYEKFATVQGLQKMRIISESGLDKWAMRSASRGSLRLMSVASSSTRTPALR